MSDKFLFLDDCIFICSESENKNTRYFTTEYGKALKGFVKVMAEYMNKYYHDRRTIQAANQMVWTGRGHPFSNSPSNDVFSGILSVYMSILSTMDVWLNRQYKSDEKLFVPAIDSCMFFTLFYLSASIPQ